MRVITVCPVPLIHNQDDSACLYCLPPPPAPEPPGLTWKGRQRADPKLRAPRRQDGTPDTCMVSGCPRERSSGPCHGWKTLEEGGGG